MSNQLQRPSETKIKAVTTDRTVVYSKPQTSASIISFLEKDTEVTIIKPYYFLGDGKLWFQILSGYVVDESFKLQGTLFNLTPDWGVLLKETHLYECKSPCPPFSLEKTNNLLPSQTIFTVHHLIKDLTKEESWIFINSGKTGVYLPASAVQFACGDPFK